MEKVVPGFYEGIVTQKAADLMNVNKGLLFSALLAALPGVAPVRAAEFEVLDRFSVDGYTVLKSSADIPGGSFSVGGSTFVVKGGNIGIGTTAPNVKLEVKGDFVRFTDSAGVGTIQFNPGATTQNIYSNWYSGSEVPLQLGTAANLAAITLKAGNVGIGTTAPGYLLDINGNARIKGAGNYLYFDTIGGDAYNYITTANSYDLTLFAGRGSTSKISLTANSGLLFNTLSAERMRITETGNVGIGTTAPGAALQVVPGTDGNPQLFLSRRSGDYGLQITAYSTINFKTKLSDNLTWQTFMQACEGCASGSSHLILQPTSGNVGIGTVSPGAKLHAYVVPAAYNTVDDVLRLTSKFESVDNAASAATGSGPAIVFSGGIGDNQTRDRARIVAVYEGNNVSGLAFHTQNTADIITEKVRIQNNGNVGIGTTNPIASLDIGGTGSIKIPVGTTAERPASPANGMLRVNTTTGKLEYYNNGGWNSIGSISATGGTVTEAGGYRIHTFTSNGTFTPNSAGNVEVLVVAGGGGGGAGWYSGGGGAGGLIYNSAYSVTAQAYTVTVGGGGAGSTSVYSRGSNGENSVFGSLTAIGGGAGGSRSGQQTGVTGGSGGGASWPSTAGGSGTAQQGNAGGTNGSGEYGAAGGGAGAAGLPGNTNPYGRDGAIGAAYSISGASTYYAGGGAAGSDGTVSRVGGLGGGGRSSNTSIAAGNGTPNTGGGGGGGSSVENGGGSGTYERGGNGGSGIVIIKYPN